MLWSFLIIEELVRNKINYFCISPGSRSTPLTYSAVKNKNANTIICLDERGAAYHALGYARATGRPAVLICTSGTAGANYYPAIIEASKNHIPIIILTADRPFELQNTGANQTINQEKLYGQFIAWETVIPCPTNSIAPEIILTTIDQTVYQAKINGPVHVNCRFRKPFISNQDIDFINTFLPLSWKNNDIPYTKYADRILSPDSNCYEYLENIIKNTEHGLLIIGELNYRHERESVLAFIKKINWPVFVDITSGVRGNGNIKNIFPYYDIMLLSEKFTHKYKPDTIIHIGGNINSKRLLNFIKKAVLKNYLMACSHPLRYDPVHKVSYRIETDISIFCKNACDIIKKLNSTRQISEWYDNLIKASKSFSTYIKDYLEKEKTLSEPGIAYVISKCLHSEHALFLSNSMPIRDMDSFADLAGETTEISANRGASGIEGLIACAAGFAQGSKKPVTLIIGDIAFLHDLNSIIFIKKIKIPVVIILINNFGGGIFSFLPIAEHEKICEEFFSTSHTIKFKKAVEMFGINYYNPKTIEDLTNTYKSTCLENQSCIIELHLDRKDNFKYHNQLFKDVRTFLDRILNSAEQI